MDLDDLLSGVDLDKLPSKSPSKSVPKGKTQAAAANAKENFDDILNDAASSVLTVDSAPKSSVPAPSGDRILSSEINPWLAASANCPKDNRDKWTKMIKKDLEITTVSQLQPSYAYQNWNHSAPTKNGIDRCLQEMVKKSALKCGLSDSKTSKILNLVNPVTDHEHGKQIHEAYAKQVILDFNAEILTDPNLDRSRFSELAKIKPL
jgi:hypothetical protein